MPSIYTHDYFAKNTYKKLEKENIYKLKNKTFYYIFSQSFDTLYYYNFLSLKPGRKYRDIGHYAHTHKTWLYFKNMIEYIKENKLYDDENLGYIYGSLAHYALDSTCHPYIHYISGRFDKKDLKNTKQYMGNHAITEISIDSLYYSKDHNSKYSKYKMYNDLIPRLNFSDSLKKTIDYTFKKTFNIENVGRIYNKSYNQSHYIYKYLMYDKYGLKKFIYKIVDFITPFKKFKANTYSHHINNPNINLLNLEKNTWIHPVTGDKYNDSFEELYNKSQKKLIKYIKKCNNYFNNKCSIQDVEREIKNLSYSSGLDLKTKSIFKYFKI